jgi:hypothetical protein
MNNVHLRHLIASWTEVIPIIAAGQVVGYYDDNTGVHAFLDINGTISTIRGLAAMQVVFGHYVRAFAPGWLGANWLAGMNPSADAVRVVADMSGLTMLTGLAGHYGTPQLSRAVAPGIESSGRPIGGPFTLPAETADWPGAASPAAPAMASIRRWTGRIAGRSRCR